MTDLSLEERYKKVCEELILAQEFGQNLWIVVNEGGFDEQVTPPVDDNPGELRVYAALTIAQELARENPWLLGQEPGENES